MMAIDFIRCANTQCTNRVFKLGEYCPTCIAAGLDVTKQEKIDAALEYLNKKPTRKDGKKK